MSLTNWISDRKKKRALERQERLQQDFAFLIKELRNNQEKEIKQLIDQEHEKWNLKAEELEQRVIDSIHSIEIRFVEKSADLSERISMLQREHQTDRDQWLSRLDSLMNKIAELDVSNQKLQENSRELFKEQWSEFRKSVVKNEEKLESQLSEQVSTFKNEMEELRKCMESQKDELLQLSESVGGGIREIQKNSTDIIEKQAETVKDHTDSILLSIDEIKALMKIIAVNNLLDEITLEETKSKKRKTEKEKSGGIFSSLFKFEETSVEDLRKLGLFRDK